MTAINSELAVVQLFHECGLQTWQDTHRRWVARRALFAVTLVLFAIALGFGVAWLAPGLLHAIHQGQNGASLLRQSVSRVGG